jgi:hypothetical protein
VADRVEENTIRSINMVQIGRALTDAKLDPPIRALVVYNSNPAVIAPSQNLACRSTPRTRRRGTSTMATWCAPSTTGARCG